MDTRRMRGKKGRLVAKKKKTVCTRRKRETFGTRERTRGCLGQICETTKVMVRKPDRKRNFHERIVTRKLGFPQNWDLGDVIRRKERNSRKRTREFCISSLTARLDLDLARSKNEQAGRSRESAYPTRDRFRNRFVHLRTLFTLSFDTNVQNFPLYRKLLKSSVRIVLPKIKSR